MRKKVIASTTHQGWRESPHVSYIYEADVTDFYEEYKILNSSDRFPVHIALNTLLMRVIVEGIKATPQINAHIRYNPFLVSGRITIKEEININMPFLLDGGEMITINLHNFESKTLIEMAEYINNINEKIKNTNSELALLDVGLHDTVKQLKKMKLLKVAGRLAGLIIGRNNAYKFSKKDKRAHSDLTADKKLNIEDLNQGTITVSNLGAAVKGTKGFVGILDIVPPQVCVVGIGAMQEKPGVYYAEDKSQQIGVRKIIPFTIAFDHRALDFSDIAPFINKLESIFSSPSVIHTW